MRRIFIIPASFIFLSCGSEKAVLQPEGSSAEIYLSEGKAQIVELLAMQDSTLVCAADTLLQLPLSSIRSLRLKIYESRGWIAPVLLFQALPSSLLAGLGQRNSIFKSEYGLLGLGVTGLTWAAFEFSGPRVSFQQPWIKEDVEQLRLHMRYPQGLNDEQIAALRGSLVSKKH